MGFEHLFYIISISVQTHTLLFAFHSFSKRYLSIHQYNRGVSRERSLL